MVVDGATRGDIELDVAGSTPLTFSELYDAEFLALVRLATLLTGRVEVARDVVQDAFVKLHVRWSTVRDPLPYVRRSVVNGCHSYHRRRVRRGDVPLDGHDRVSALDVDHTLATLALLTPNERACVVLKYYEDRTEREIADLVGCRPGSVGPTVHRALAKLREAQS
jgi:RNA polymerase sigma factor (sigma-70 family)